MFQFKRLVYVVLIAGLVSVTYSFRQKGIFALKQAVKVQLVTRTKVLRDVTNELQHAVEKQDPNKLIGPSHKDMMKYSYILGNITSHMSREPEKAISIVSQDLGWLLARNVTE